MKKISLLAVVAVSCACIMACNNAPEEPVEDTIVEETPVVATPAPVDTVVEAVAEPAPAPTKTTVKEEVKKDGTATGTVSTTKKSSNKIDASTPLVPTAQTSGTATSTQPKSASQSSKKIGADSPLI
jgi:hypothetical protein